MLKYFKGLVAVTLALMLANGAQAFPQDGMFFQGTSCPAEGFAAADQRRATLAFPILCMQETCCDLSNPINVRAMDQTFLYDATCERGDASFEARLLVGEASIDGLVVVFQNLAHTYARCEP